MPIRWAAMRCNSAARVRRNLPRGGTSTFSSFSTARQYAWLLIIEDT